jgi:hypothetical protein
MASIAYKEYNLAVRELKMLHKMLDRLLAMHFREPPADHRLDRLERDVWHRIHATTTEGALPWQEKMLLAFSVPRFQIASLAIAVVLGLSLSPAIPLGSTARTEQPIADLQVFTVHAPYLTANLIERSE